jgi:UDP-glucose 4-epimerase
MANVLITGGSGLIGWRATELLVEQGHEVVVFDLRPNMANLSHVADKITVVTGDVTDLARVLHVMKRYRIDHVLHLAAFIAHESKLDPGGAFKVNVGGTTNIFDAALAADVKRVVWTSSVTALTTTPDYDGRAVDESYTVVARNPYGASKWGCEIVADGYRNDLGLDVMGVRPALTYGVGRLSGGTGVFNESIRQVALGQPTGIMSTTAGLHQPMYNRDMAGLLITALFGPRTEHHIFNVPTESDYTDEQLLGTIRRIVPDAQVHTEPVPPYVPPIPVVDGSLGRKEIAYTPRYDLEAGLREMIDHFRATANS